MRAVYIASPLRPRRLARRDLGGHPAVRRSTRRREVLPALAELVRTYPPRPDLLAWVPASDRVLVASIVPALEAAG